LESYKDQKIIIVEKVTKLTNQISGDNDVGDFYVLIGTSKYTVKLTKKLLDKFGIQPKNRLIRGDRFHLPLAGVRLKPEEID
jgi:hypothetical protein